MELRRGNTPQRPSFLGVILAILPGTKWALVVVNDECPWEEIAASWDNVVDALWGNGFRQDIYYEYPDAMHREHAFYLIPAS